MKTIICTHTTQINDDSLPNKKSLEYYVKSQENLERWIEFSFDSPQVGTNGSNQTDSVVDIIEATDEKVAICCDSVDQLVKNTPAELPKLEELIRNGDICLHFPSDSLILHEGSSPQERFTFNMAICLAQYHLDMKNPAD